MEFFASLEAHAHAKGEQEFCVWLDSAGKVEDRRTFLQLWSNAQQVARILEQKGVAQGDRVILCYNFGLAFLDAFLGCMFCKAIPVPTYPPNPSEMEKALGKLKLIVENSGSRLTLLGKDVDRLRRVGGVTWPKQCSYMVLPALATTNLNDLVSAAAVCQLPLESPAFIQYTSGSTGDPKGVVLTYRNLLANFDLMREAYVRDGSVGDPDTNRHCSWLPQFHDLGLITCTLWPLFLGGSGVYFSPTSFIKNPLMWMSAMSDHKCTTTAAPNFAYGLTAKRMLELPEGRRPKLDLSPTNVWTCAAEPNRPETLSKFASVFQGSGLRGTFNLSYGLAEHTVFVSATGIGVHGVTAAKMVDSTGQFVCCGSLPLCEGVVDVRIVDPEARRELPDGARGEVWLRSSSAAECYWGMPDRSAETFAVTLDVQEQPLPPLADATGECRRSCFLRTGDEGVIQTRAETGARTLYYCGRIKDLIIIRGRNVYPQDVEHAVEQAVPAIRPNSSAAFQGKDESGADAPTVEMVCELRSTTLAVEEMEGMAVDIARRLRGECSLALQRLVFIRARCIPKTTSGKIQRKATQQALAGGGLLRHALLVWEDSAASREQAQAVHGEGGAVAGAAEEGVLQRLAQELSVLAGCDVGPDEPLGVVGLDSISTAELCQRLSIEFNQTVEPHVVFEAATLRDLIAQLLSQQQSAGEDGAAAEESDSEHMASGSGSHMQDHEEEAGNKPDAHDGGGKCDEDQGRRRGAVATVAMSAAYSAVQLASFCAVLLVLSACVVPGAVVFERIADHTVFRGLRFYRYRVKPHMLQDVELVPRAATEVTAIIGDEAPAGRGVYLHTGLAMLAAGGAILCSLLLCLVVLKWLLLGRVTEGVRPLWGWFYWRRWMVQQLAGMVLSMAVIVCPDGGVLAALYWCLGARVGRGCRIRGLITQDWDLLTFDDGASVSGSAAVIAGVVCHGSLYLQKVHIGARCEVGEKAAVMPGTELPPCTLVSNHAVASPATVLPPEGGCVLHGKPAQATGGADERGLQPFKGAAAMNALEQFGFPLSWALLLAAASGVCLLPVVALDVHAFSAGMPGWVLPLRLLCYVAVFWLSFCVCTLASKWVLLGRMQAGTVVGQRSLLRLRREMVHRMADLSFRLVFNRTCFSEVQCCWFRALGARIGPGVVLGGLVSMHDWDSVSIGARVLIGGGAQIKTVKSADVEGDVIVAGVTIEQDTMVGSDSCLAAGSSLGAHTVIGSRSWVDESSAVPEFSVVVGSKQRVQTQRAYVPGQARPARQGSVLGVFIAIFVFCLGTYGTMLALLWVAWALGDSVTGLVLLWPAAALTLCGGMTLWAIVTKWVFMGCFQEGTYALCGTYGLQYLCTFHAMRHCLLFNPICQWFKGGPIANLVLRGLGAKVDLMAFVNSMAIFDVDLVTIEEGAAINENAVIACHSIADTFSCSLAPIRIGREAVMWPTALVFGGHSIPAGQHLGPQSVQSHSASHSFDHDVSEPCQCTGSPERFVVRLGVPATDAVELFLTPEVREQRQRVDRENSGWGSHLAAAHADLALPGPAELASGSFRVPAAAEPPTLVRDVRG